MMTIMFGTVIGSAVTGHWVASKQKSRWQGWMAGIVTLAIGAIAFGPSIAALRETSCLSASDHRACLEDDNDG